MSEHLTINGRRIYNIYGKELRASDLRYATFYQFDDDGDRWRILGVPDDDVEEGLSDE